MLEFEYAGHIAICISKLMRHLFLLFILKLEYRHRSSSPSVLYIKTYKRNRRTGAGRAWQSGKPEVTAANTELAFQASATPLVLTNAPAPHGVFATTRKYSVNASKLHAKVTQVT